MLAMARPPLRFFVAQSNLAEGYYNFTPEIPELLCIPQLGAKHARHTPSLRFAPHGQSQANDRGFLMSTSNGIALSLVKAPRPHSKLDCTINLATTGSLAWSYQRVRIEGEHDRRILPRLRVLYRNGVEACFRWKKDGLGGLTLSAINSSRPFATYTPPTWPCRNGILCFYPGRIPSLTREDMALFSMFLALTMSTSACFPLPKPCASPKPQPLLPQTPVVHLSSPINW